MKLKRTRLMNPALQGATKSREKARRFKDGPGFS
jgi:hypothetical protein